MSRLILVILLVGMLLLAHTGDSHTAAQPNISPTPNRVIISTSTPLATAGSSPTPVPPTFTPTEQGPPQLQVASDSGEINVRAEPDPNSASLGLIRTGEFFTITGQFYMWYRIRFDPSPNGTGYVFSGLVEVLGDESEIVDLVEEGFDASAGGTEIPNETATLEAFLLTPGGGQTLTADVSRIEAPSGERSAEVTPEAPSAESTQAVVSLPTFTPPPNFTPQTPTEVQLIRASATPDPTGGLGTAVAGGVAPIVPIGVLVGLGLLGLFVSLLRR